MKGRTILMITHRFSVAKDADYIFVMNQGRVIQQGSHDELIVQYGLYRKLCRSSGDAMEMEEIG